MSHANEKEREGGNIKQDKGKGFKFCILFAYCVGPAGLLLFFALLKRLAN